MRDGDYINKSKYWIHSRNITEGDFADDPKIGHIIPPLLMCLIKDVWSFSIVINAVSISVGSQSFERVINYMVYTSRYWWQW